MKSYDFDAVTYDGAAYCVACLPKGVDANDSDVCSAIFADSEWDSYPVCHACGRTHDYVSLTSHGRTEAWIREYRITDDELATLRGFCEAWHGGQWTNAYAYLSSGARERAYDAYCELSRAVDRWTGDDEDIEAERAFIDAIEAKKTTGVPTCEAMRALER
jgi:hypothetical protein